MFLYCLKYLLIESVGVLLNFEFCVILFSRFGPIIFDLQFKFICKMEAILPSNYDSENGAKKCEWLLIRKWDVFFSVF